MTYFSGAREGDFVDGFVLDHRHSSSGSEPRDDVDHARGNAHLVEFKSCLLRNNERMKIFTSTTRLAK